MKFRDEPVPGEPLPILPGHSSAGRFERILRAGEFVVTAELSPPDSADPEEVYRLAHVFDGYVDAINATDGSGANCHMSSVGICAILTRIGYAPIMQLSCRDRNRIAIQGEILGAAAMGVGNLLCLTGDGVQVGDHPQAKPVFDLDCMSLLNTACTMRDKQEFLSGRKLSSPPNLFLGAAANPFAPPFSFRPHRLAKKIEAGAQFIQTQYCYDIERFKEYMKQVRDLGLAEKCFILAGIGPIASAKAGSWIRENIPGIHIPDWIIKRLANAQKQKTEGRKICIELIQQIKEIPGVSGIHVMAYRQEESVAEIIEASKVLGERVPWYPGREDIKPLFDQKPDLPAFYKNKTTEPKNT